MIGFIMSFIIIMLGPATLWFRHAPFTTTNILHLHCYVMLQSSEVPNSSWCELEGLKRSVDLLRGKDLHLATLITDRHRQVFTIKMQYRM